MLGRIKKELKKLRPIDIDESALDDLEEFKKLPDDVRDKLRRGFIESLKLKKMGDKEKKPKPRKILPEPRSIKRWYT